MTLATQPATKKDVEDIMMRVLNAAIDQRIIPLVQKIVGDTVSEIVGDALQAIDDRFNRVEARLDRIEDKLDRMAATIDLHTVDIRQLTRKFA